ncbi:hypothetical protein, partial [Corynebacterium amycolatum]
NNQLTVVRNDDFAGEHKARNNGLVYRFYSDVDTAYADLQAQQRSAKKESSRCMSAKFWRLCW